MRTLFRAGAGALLAALSWAAAAQPPAPGKTYRVDCGIVASPSSAHAEASTLHSLDEVNALTLQAHDTVLFRRGTVCHGALHPQGNGFSLRAYGQGALPRIEAGAEDEAALRLFNQDGLTIDSLEFRGGTTYGIYVSGNKGTMRSIFMNNLTVRDVRGVLKHKESGLIVIQPSSPGASFFGIRLDGIRAFNTTQWSGIFIAGASLENPANQVTVVNSVVHDVQGDGIVLFNARNGVIQDSVAWHTGMQHQQTIGTPNAIWTWQCIACSVVGNEAFLTDTPGIDGGAFDIDWGNSMNKVQRNFGHDTQGYCVSVFAANGPTRLSTVDGNLCLNNGMSPRLAQRQGAILLMTWNGGSLERLSVSNNRVDWHPPGNTPAIQSGAKIAAESVSFSGNEIYSRATTFVDPAIPYTGKDNKYFLEDATAADLTTARSQIHAAGETGSTVTGSPTSPLRAGPTHAKGWQLAASVNMQAFALSNAPYGPLFINLKTAAAEYGSAGLLLSLSSDAGLLQTSEDWGLVQDGVRLHPMTTPDETPITLKLISPEGRTVQTWTKPASSIDLGLALRHSLGSPDYSRLNFENVRATD